MKKESNRLADLAVRVSDGFQVDWEEAESGLSSAEKHLAENLRAVAGVAGGYRNLQGLDPEEHPSAWGPLEMIEAIGSGAFSRVYRARDPQLDREVALKLHHNREAADVVIQEARRLSRIRHPNVLTIYGADLVDGQPGIWTELIRGETLAQIIKNQGPMGQGEAIHVGLELCRALASVHGAGILHRDIKAQNVMREQGGRLVLMDFGAGLLTDEDGKGRTSGTPLYMAPELFLGHSASVQSDLYSLGVLLFYLLTGTFPVKGDSIQELREAHEQGPRRLLRDLRPEASDRFVEVVERALDRDPAKRFPSAGAMAQALQGCIADGERKRRPGKLLPWRILAIVAILSALGAAVVHWWPSRAGPYSVEAHLRKVTSSGAETLVSGASVQPGDRLFLEFQSSRTLHVYVLDRDERGEAFLLFPLPGDDVANPLPANQTVRLPGTQNGEEVFWQVTSPGGQEHFLLIASPNALTEFERQIELLDRPRMGRPVLATPLGNQPLETLRGIGGLSPAIGGTETPGPDPFESALKLIGTSSNETGVWVRKIEVVNP